MVLNTAVNIRIESNSLMTSTISLTYTVNVGGPPGVKPCEGLGIEADSPASLSSWPSRGDRLEADHFIPV